MEPAKACPMQSAKVLRDSSLELYIKKVHSTIQDLCLFSSSYNEWGTWTRWAAESDLNYAWTLVFFETCISEYERRFNKLHDLRSETYNLKAYDLLSVMEHGPMTTFIQFEGNYSESH